MPFAAGEMRLADCRSARRPNPVGSIVAGASQLAAAPGDTIGARNERSVHAAAASLEHTRWRLSRRPVLRWLSG